MTDYLKVEGGDGLYVARVGRIIQEQELVLWIEEIDRNTLRYARLEFDYGWVWTPADYELRMSCERAGQTYRLVDELAGPQSPTMAGVRRR